MYAGSDFQNSTVGESEVYSFDFENDIASGETLSVATFTLSVHEGTDASPSSRLSGSSSISGTIASQRLTGLQSNVTYNLSCSVTTSLNNTLILWARVTSYPAGTP